METVPAQTDNVISGLDLAIFFAALLGAMAVGLLASRQKHETAEEYFLAGRTTRWWGVAASIFGSNVSANHLVGMLGIGFSVGFAQTHFELGAIAGLMLLCYGFLPVYRKLGLYTLSEYLGRRYDERSRVLYAVSAIIIMAVFQMVGGLYIGARFACVLLGERAVEVVQAGAGAESKLLVNDGYYIAFVIALAVIAASYTILGGLRAVIWTDVIQSVLLLISGLVLAVLTFHEIGGWGEMMALDRAAETEKMHLYLPPDHPQLPWTGVLTGLLFMHCYYWGTNQFIVQRALSARSDAEARLGIIAAGFLKMLIPFFAIGTGVASYYLFKERLPGRSIAPDTAFTELVKLVIPVGYGVVGIIAAGVIGAILSSVDSMMNSAATMVSVDIYKRYIRPNASDGEMIRVGRLSIAAFVTLAACVAIFVINPNSKENFFLEIVKYQSYLTPGLLVPFFLGMFWRRATATGAFVTILSGVLFSVLIEKGYNHYYETNPEITAPLGAPLNFFYRAFAVIILCSIVHVSVSLLTRRDPEKERLTWTELGGHDPVDLHRSVRWILLSLAIFAGLGLLMVYAPVAPFIAGTLAAAWTLLAFLIHVARLRGRAAATRASWLREDRFWAGLLCAVAVFLMYYYY